MDESTLLSIKEFSDLTGVSQSTLRYYDDIGLLTPVSRGENNYRYYQPFQIIKLNYIHVLIDLGLPLSAIKEMDSERTPEKIANMLSEQEVALDYRLYKLRMAYSIIHTYRSNIQKGLAARDGEIRVEELPESHYVLGRATDAQFKSDEAFYDEFVRFCKSANDYRINLRFPIGGYHDDMTEFLRAPNRPDKFFSLDPMGNSTRPKGKYLQGFKLGYYGEFGDLPQKMEAYAAENGLVCKGPVFVVYLLDEVSIIDPGKYLSRVAVQVY